MQTAPILLITRPASDGERLAKAVAAQCPVPFDTIYSPVIRIVDEPIVVDAPPAGLVLTSANGALAAGRLPELAGLPAWCVGDHTADVARQHGLKAISAGRDADALVRLVLAQRPFGPLLHLHGAHVRGNVAARIIAGGIPCQSAIAYRQEAQVLSDSAVSAVNGDRPVILPVYSPRTGRIIAQQGPFSAPLHIVAISAATAETCRPLRPETLQQALNPDSTTMIGEILKLLISQQL